MEMVAVLQVIMLLILVVVIVVIIVAELMFQEKGVCGKKKLRRIGAEERNTI